MMDLPHVDPLRQLLVALRERIEQTMVDQHRLGNGLRTTTDRLKDREAQLVIMEAEHNER